MENLQKTLERLIHENEKLKKLIVETESEMENMKIKAYEDMMKTKQILKNLPLMMKSIRKSSSNQFTQCENQKDFTQAILLLGNLDFIFETLQVEINDVQTQNAKITEKIQGKEHICEELLEQKEAGFCIIHELNCKKSALLLEISTLQTKALLYKDIISDTLPLSIISAFDCPNQSY